MPPRIEGKQLSLILRDEQIEKIDKIAARHGRTRADTVRLMLDVGIDAYEAYEVVGVPQLAELVRKTRRALEKYIQPTLY